MSTAQIQPQELSLLHAELTLKMVGDYAWSMDLIVRDQTTGDPMDITGAAFVLTAYETQNLTGTPAFTLSSGTSGITVTDAANGALTISVTAAQNDGRSGTTLYYSFDIEFAGGDFEPYLRGPIKYS